MLRRLTSVAAGTLLAALAIATPAMASPAARVAAPDTSCNINTAYCYLFNGDGLWISETGANKGIIGDSPGSTAWKFTFDVRPQGVWGEMVDANGNCWNYDAATAQTVISGCNTAFTNGNELVRPVPCGTGNWCFDSYDLGTGALLSDQGLGAYLLYETGGPQARNEWLAQAGN